MRPRNGAKLGWTKSWKRKQWPAFWAGFLSRQFCAMPRTHLIGFLWVFLFISQSECFVLLKKLNFISFFLHWISFFLYYVSLKLHSSQPMRIENFFMFIIKEDNTRNTKIVIYCDVHALFVLKVASNNDVKRSCTRYDYTEFNS